MTTTPHGDDRLPLSRQELQRLADYYDAHDTAEDMTDGTWVDPRPMKTTSLRLPSDVIEALKTRAAARGMRYTTLLREIIESAATDSEQGPAELAEINARLARIEAAITNPAPHHPADGNAAGSPGRVSVPRGTGRGTRSDVRPGG